MSSIIGQMGAGGGPSMSGVGSWLGSFLGGSGAPSTAGLGTTPFSIPSDTAFSAGGPSSSGVPYAGMGYSDPSAGTSTGGLFPSATPADVLSPSGVTGAPYTPTDSSGGGMAAPSPEAVMNPGTVGGTSAAPFSPAAGAPPTTAGPTFLQELENFLGGGGAGAGGGTGAGGAGGGWLTPKNIAAMLTAGGGLAEAIQRWQIQRNLLNPAAGAAALYKPMSKALTRRVTAPVTAAAQETGQINAPGLYAQAVANALAPYQQEMEMNALRAYIASQQAAAGVYPQGGIFGSAGLVPAGTFGGYGEAQGGQGGSSSSTSP
jgi:hypothetical protein